LKSVCDEELDGGKKYSTWPLVPASHRSAIEARLTKFLEESGPLLELDNAQPIYDQNEQVKKQNKALLVGLRNQPVRRKGETFAEYYRSNADNYASFLIEGLALDRPQIKLDAWRRDPQKFPHFTAFVELYTYVPYDAQRNQNSRLDSNWLPDAEQLCFLVDVDAIVSSECGFMSRAFEALWQPRQKRIFTPEEFVAHVSRIH